MEQKQSRFNWKRFFFAIKWIWISGGFITLSYLVVFGCTIAARYGGVQWANATEWVSSKVTRVEIKREIVPVQSIPTGELIQSLAFDAGINPVILQAIAEQESGTGIYQRTDRIRFEPSLMSKVKIPAGLNEIERQLYASSIGVMQIIYGLHREHCHLQSYVDLLDPARNIQCSITILKANLAVSHGKTAAARLREAMRMYNGSGPDAEVYANKMMQRLADLLLTDLGDAV